MAGVTAEQPAPSVVSSWRVAIIDDVYAGPNIEAVRIGLPEFCAEISANDEAVGRLTAITNCDFTDPALVTDEAVAKLYDSRSGFAELAEPIQQLFLQYEQRRTEVDKIEGYLKLQGCEPTRFHSMDGVFEGDPFQLVFLDLLLAKGGDQEAQEIAKRIYREFNAFILLMSNSPGAKSPVQIEEFRRKTRLLSGFFHFCAKEELCNQERFRTQLESLPSDPRVCNAVHRLVIAIEDALGGNIEEPEPAQANGGDIEEPEPVQANGGEKQNGLPLRQFMQTFRTLGLHDYALLCELTLRDEGHPLGDYVIRLLGSHLLSRLLADDDVRTAVSALDKLRFTEFLPFGDSASPSFHRMYGDSTTEEITDPWSAHPWSVEAAEKPAETKEEEPAAEPALADSVTEEDANSPESEPEEIPLPPDIMALLQLQDDERPLPFLQLGDLLIHDKSAHTYVVLNAACDLQFVPRNISKARGERPRDDTVLLLPGRLRKIADAVVPKSQTTAGLIEWKGDWFCIDWFDGKMLGVPHCIVRKLLEDCGYIHTRRLQTARALELQQAVLHKLSRIGLAVRPPFPRDVTFTLYGKKADLAFVQLGDPLTRSGLLFHGRTPEDRLIVLRQSAFYECAKRMNMHAQTAAGEPQLPPKLATGIPQAAAHFMVKMVGMRWPIAVPTSTDVSALKLISNTGKNLNVAQIGFRFGTFDTSPVSSSKTKELMFCLSAEER